MSDSLATPRRLAWGAASSRARMTFVITTLVIAGLMAFASSHFQLGWKGASASAALLLAALVWFVFTYKDRLFLHLLVFGLVVGFAELPSDYLAVEQAKILVYPKEGPFIWASPLYMPFSYVIVMAQFGYLGYWAAKKWNLWVASIGLAAFGALNVPSYEYLAKQSNFWYYQNCPMLFDTVPYLTIAVEAAFSMVLALFAVLIARSLKWTTTIGLGIAEGIWIYICSVVAIALLG